MRDTCLIGLIGDYDPSVTAHQAIPLALRSAAREVEAAVEFDWLPTDEVEPARLSRHDGFWCVPASPYRSTERALAAIRHARESSTPFLGTCGGFQHAVLEYARNVLGWADAEHAETAPRASRAVVSLLECALVEAQDSVRLIPGTRIAEVYGKQEIAAEYRCRFGLNERFRSSLTSGPLCAAALDRAGSVRAVELDQHPFFVATLFQPERAALRGERVPLAAALVRAAHARAQTM